MMFSKLRFVKIVVVMLAVLSIVACQKKDPVKKAGSEKPTMAAHSISAEDKKLLIEQTDENIKIITKVRTDKSALKKALSGIALSTFSDQIDKDLDEGKIKIRKYDSVKFEVGNVTSGVVGVKMTFIDRSYYVDKDSKEKISSPTNNKESFILACQKVKKRWKIFTFFTTKLKDKANKE